MSRYLYCAAVQGIQEFIFKTKELRHIVGASELVEKICTDAFNEFRGSAGDEGFIVRAAGNIKFLFDNESDCRKAIREFPKKVMSMAPGVTISQAVCQLKDNSVESFAKAVSDAEQKLKIQRNITAPSLTLGWMGMKRSTSTGSPLIFTSKYSSKDEATLAKASYNNLLELSKKSFGKEDLRDSNIAYEISDITGDNDWIAVIHADGNGLGKVIQKIGERQDIFKEFSNKLNEATIEAAHKAYLSICESFDTNKRIPIRPVVLSGDDMTTIIRGDLAIPYTKAFLHAFEDATKNILGSILKENEVFDDHSDMLTACAGIAFIKSSYPFYYGYALAEQLCQSAKKDCKELVGIGKNLLPPSCLMFHKVQDSFIIDYEDIVKRELLTDDHLLFKAGPYYINKTDNRYQIDDLENFAAQLNIKNDDKNDGVRSGVRRWISLRLKDEKKAKQHKDRMLDIYSNKDNKDLVNKLTSEVGGTCVAYDVLAYYTIMNQVTKNQ